MLAKRRANREVMRYRFKRTPYRHQVAALKKLISTKWGGALIMDPRTGKTAVAIDYASVLHQGGKVNRVLVLCPLGVMGVWEDEIAAVCPVKHRVLVWDKEARKVQALPRFGQDVLDFVVLNHDALSVAGAITGTHEDGTIKRSKNRGGRYDMRKKLKAWQPQLIVVDESHRFGSPSAAKTRSLHSIGPVADYRVVMTGTAITKKKKVFTIYPQWKFLDPEGWIKGYTMDSFKHTFARWTNRDGYPRWLGNDERAMQRLRLNIHKDSFAITRDECYDLPPSRDQIVPVQLTGHGAEVYDEMAEEMIALIKTGEMSEAQIKLVLRLRLAQITSGIVKTLPTDQRPEGRLVRVGRDKLNVAQSLLEDWFEAEEKVVIAARFRADIASLSKLCSTKLKVKTFELHGGVKRRERDANIKAFRAHSGPAAFVMQPGAGSLGIDLSTSSTMLWYSLIDSFVDYSQAKDRIALSPRGTVHVHLLAKGTVDYDMYRTLQEDADFVRMVQASPDRLRRNFKD